MSRFVFTGENGGKELDEKRFVSINAFRQRYGVPNHFLRSEVKAGRVPGFRSGKNFYIDSETYLPMLSARYYERRGHDGT